MSVRTQLKASLYRDRFMADLGALVDALMRIASFDDELADAHLRQTGSYGAFDEPGSVEIAREALARIGITDEKIRFDDVASLAREVRGS